MLCWTRSTGECLTEMRRAVEGVQQALQAGCNPGEVLSRAMIAAMAQVGRRFEVQDCFCAHAVRWGGKKNRTDGHGPDPQGAGAAYHPA